LCVWEDSLAACVGAGGRAVVFVSGRADACAGAATLAGFTLPRRDLDGVPSDPAREGTLEPPQAPEPRRAALEGPLLRAGRVLELPAPIAFLPESAWSEAERGAGGWAGGAALGRLR